MKVDRELIYPYTKLGIAELDCFGSGLVIDSTDWTTSPMEDRYPYLKAQKLSQSAHEPEVDGKAEDEAELEYLVKKMRFGDRKLLCEEPVVVDKNI